MSEHNICPKFEKTFTMLGKKWTGLIIKILLDGPKRFSEITALLPELSDRMLTERFKELESLGVITRTVYPETPVRIEYSLTESGRDLLKSMEELQKWAERWII
jgi:DNA-binding HxlR family transcriptional regulator